mmetsp:Transcript_30365/g.90548  ORF Transcript_30365/g.90548 Transcript_30365/m.90548 type:complete len:82 (-) Transcript_30365:392-637(-)
MLQRRNGREEISLRTMRFSLTGSKYVNDDDDDGDSTRLDSTRLSLSPGGKQEIPPVRGQDLSGRGAGSLYREGTPHRCTSV